MNTHKLVCVDLNYPVNFICASDDGRVHSRPVHVLTSVNFSDCISDVAAVHSADNFSDHLPSFNFSLVADTPISGSSITEQSISGLEALPKVCWYKITPEHTDHYLETLSKPLPPFPSDLANCCSPDCAAHLSVIDSLCDKLIISILSLSLCS